MALGAVSLLTDFSTELVYPLVPVFLAGLGAGPLFIGLVEGVAETTASLTKLAAGWISDRLRRRKALVVAGYGLSSLTRPLMAMAAAPWQVLAIRFTDRVGKGVRGAPRDALIADGTAGTIRGKAFGFHRAMDHLGAVLGPLLAFALLGAGAAEGLEVPLASLRQVFWVATVPAALAVLVLWLWVREVPPAAPARRAEAREAAPPGPPAFSGRFRAFLMVVVVFTLGNSSDAFLLLRAHEAGVAAALLPLLWALLHVVKSLASVPCGVLSDRIGRRPVILAGWTVYAAVYLGFAWAEGAWEMAVLFAVYGLYFGLTEGVVKAYVADLVPSRRRSSAFGALGFAEGLAALPASLGMGLLWTGFGARTAFLVGASLALAAMGMLAFLPAFRRSAVRTGG